MKSRWDECVNGTRGGMLRHGKVTGRVERKSLSFAQQEA